MTQRTDLPWSIYSRSAVETAQHLINQAGGVKKAHRAVKAAAAAMKQKPGKPPTPNDQLLLLMADAIRRDDGCLDNTALKKVADMQLDKSALEKVKPGLQRERMLRNFEGKKDATVRRLRNKLEGGTLEAFAQRYDIVADRVDRDDSDPALGVPGVRFVFRAREGK
jgi:hypothetical protein